jgi:hypothetical protein
MAELGYEVNPDEPEKVFDVVPAADYIAMIIDSDYVATKSGSGMMLKLTYEILDGPMKGRKLFEQLNLANKSKDAEDIARRTLNSIGLATGVTNIKDSSLLHGIPLKLEVKVKDSVEYGKQNVIKKHLPAKGGAPANTGSADSAPAPTGAAPKKPWEKK